jgi:hypothetical protein
MIVRMFDQLETALREAEQAMAGLDPDTLIGTQPSVGVDLLIRHERVTAAARLAMVARAEQMHPWQREGYRSFEEWLAARQGTSHGRARKKARTARKLRDRDKTADALADGEISEDEADVIADAADKNPDAEQDLLDTARNKGKGHDDLKKKAADAKAAGEDDRARAERLRRGRRAGWGVDRDGFWTLHGRFQPQIGVEIKAHLSAEVDRIITAARRAGTREPLDRYRADAIAAAILGREPAGPADTTTSTVSHRSPADASGGDGRLDLGLDPEPATDDRDPAAPEPDPAPPAADQRHMTPPVGPGRELVIDINLQTLRRGQVHPGETCHLRGIGPVPVHIARQWAHDAFIKAVIRDGTDVKKVAHFGRHIPTHLRTALGVIDTTCAVPGCTNPRIEYDHHQPHAENGPTSLDNLRPLCVHHHRQRTHHGYELEGPPGDRRWIAPDGRVLFADRPDRADNPDRAP